MGQRRLCELHGVTRLGATTRELSRSAGNEHVLGRIHENLDDRRRLVRSFRGWRLSFRWILLWCHDSASCLLPVRRYKPRVGGLPVATEAAHESRA